MNNLQVKFEPIPLLDRILQAGNIAPEEQEVLLAGFRTLVRDGMALQMTHFLRENRKLQELLEQSSEKEPTPEGFVELFTKLIKGVGQKIPQEKLQAIVVAVFMTAFLEVANSVIKTVSEENREKICQILDQDSAFNTIYSLWLKS